MKSLIIIPARMESERLPGKPLLMVKGITLLYRTYIRAAESHPNSTIVATSDPLVINYCKLKGLNWMDTGEHPTGTHRCAEAAAKLTSRYDVVVNWQVDEPLVESADVERMIKVAGRNEISTLVAPLSHFHRRNRNTVKVAVSDRISHKRCRWFSRAKMLGAMGHIGVYAFDWKVLQSIRWIKPTPLSRAESLEQLAWLENAWGIHAVEVDAMPLSINTPEDLEKFKETVDAKVD